MVSWKGVLKLIFENQFWENIFNLCFWKTIPKIVYGVVSHEATLRKFLRDASYNSFARRCTKKIFTSRKYFLQRFRAKLLQKYFLGIFRTKVSRETVAKNGSISRNYLFVKAYFRKSFSKTRLEFIYGLSRAQMYIEYYNSS